MIKVSLSNVLKAADLYINKKIPNYLVRDIITNQVSFCSFMKYRLDAQGFPISIIRKQDRSIVSTFGVAIAKRLDWDLINRKSYKDVIREALKQTNPLEKDINKKMHERVQFLMPPRDYTPKMKKRYSGRIFDDFTYNDRWHFSTSSSIKVRFNRGKLSFFDIISNWHILKDKDLSYCINEIQKGLPKLYSDESFKEMMEQHGQIIMAIARHQSNVETEAFISGIGGAYNTQVMPKITETAEKVVRRIGETDEYTSDEDYRTFFTYSSLPDFMRLKGVSESTVSKFKEAEEELGYNYLVSSTSIPIAFMFDEKRVKNIVEHGIVESDIHYSQTKELIGYYPTRNNAASLYLVKGGQNG